MSYSIYYASLYVRKRTQDGYVPTPETYDNKNAGTNDNTT